MPFIECLEDASIATCLGNVKQTHRATFWKGKNVRIVSFEGGKGIFFAGLLEQMTGDATKRLDKKTTLEVECQQNAKRSNTPLKIIAKSASVISSDELKLMVAFFEIKLLEPHPPAQLCSAT